MDGADALDHYANFMQISCKFHANFERFFTDWIHHKFTEFLGESGADAMDPGTCGCGWIDGGRSDGSAARN